MKYLVMECHEDYVVLLDEEAGFVKAVNAGYTVGETIENPQLLKTVSSSRRSIIRKVTYGLATVAACFAIVFGINYYNEYMKPYSNIRLSINPDVEIVLNHHGQVLSVKGLNADGEMLVDGYNPKRQDKLVVADDLIERAIEMGFLSDDAIIIFDINTPDQSLLTQYGIELRSEAEIYTSEFANVNIVIIDRKQENTDDYDYDDKDYEPIVIPIPEQTEMETTVPETKPSVTKPPSTSPPAATAPYGDSGYNDGESNYDADSSYGDSGYDRDE